MNLTHITQNRPRLAGLRILVGAALLLIGPVAEAQRPAGHDGGMHERGNRRGAAQRHRDPEQRLERLSQELRLSPGQVTRVRAIFEDTHQRMQRLGQNAPRGSEARQRLSEQERESLRTARREIRWGAEDRLHQVLNCEQREVFRRLRRERRADRRGRVGNSERGREGNSERGRRGARGRRGGN